MNFIDKAFAQTLTGDDFLQAMAAIYSEPEVYDVLYQYPPFVADVISILDYDTALQMDGLDDIINGNLGERYGEITDALFRCGIAHEADILKKAKQLSDTDKTEYEKEYENLYNRLAFQNDYDSFWEKVKEYINQHLKDGTYEYNEYRKG